MSLFSYRAVDYNGSEIRGAIECLNSEQLKKDLYEKGYFLINCRRRKIIKQLMQYQLISKKELAVFCRQFSSMISCGINISEILQILSNQSSNKRLKENIIKIKVEVEKGQTLSDALKKYSDIYPRFLLSMVNVGEQTGKLQKAFENLSDYYEREFKTSKKIITALTYPVILSITTLVITSVLLIKIVPNFAVTLASMGGKLPLVTKVVLSISNFLKDKILYIFFLFSLILVFSVIYAKSERGKLKIDKFKLTFPLTKAIFLCMAEIKFSRSMSILLQGGNTAYKSIELLKNSTDNEYLKEKLIVSIEEMDKGKSVLETLKKTGVFEPLMISMIAIGEEAGMLEDMLYRLSCILEDDLNEIVNRLIALIQPVLVIFLALIIGVIIFSVMMPMLNIMDSIG